MTRAMETEHPAGAGERLLALLDEQAGLCRRLDELGVQQEECIEQSDTDGLLRVLGERQALVDRIAALSAQLEPMRAPAQREAAMAALAEPQRQRVRTLVADLNALAERIQRRDEAGRSALEDRRGRIAEEIAGMARVRGAVAAYGRSATGGPVSGARVHDRQG